MSILERDLLRLKDITKTCRTDMHEPDEQGLKCRVVGDHLDNACGEYTTEDAIIRGYQEYVVVLERFDGEKFQVEKFNLANLIALARSVEPWTDGE